MTDLGPPRPPEPEVFVSDPAVRTFLYPPPRVERPAPPRWGLALLLLGLTFFTTTTLGSVWMLIASTEQVADLGNLLFPAAFPVLVAPRAVVRIWTDPTLLGPGLAFSLPSLFILLCHELGHYLACRHYKLSSTLPYFLPAPLGIGTFGAFIRIRTPIRSKKELFDVGVAGPLAGFAALVPVLLLGFAWSRPVPVSSLPEMSEGMVQFLIAPGDSLATVGLTKLFHGSLGPQEVLQLHPFVFAGWLGLLATALNLIPLGQLDGGHILYAVAGRTQRRLALPLWGALLATALLVWPAWLLWCGITLVMGLFHPPVRDESRPLDGKRLAIAVLALAIFVFSFMPVPIREIVIVPGDEPLVEGRTARRLEIEHQRHRTVVDQLDLHVGAEAAGGDLVAGGAQAGGDPLDQRLGDLRGRGTGERRPATLRERRAGEGELRHDEEGAAGPGGVEVHLAVPVLEDAEPGELRGRQVRLLLAVAGLDAGEDQQAAADLPHRLAADADRRSFDSLQDQAHRSPS